MKKEGTRRLLFGFVVSVVFGGSGYAADKTDEVVSLNSGIFNAQQAKSGKKLHKRYCKSCHEGEYFVPVLLAWQGEPLTDFLDVMISAMPENDPGGLAPDEYRDILAYILKTSDYPQSQRALDPDSAEFTEIIIEPVKQN